MSIQNFLKVLLAFFLLKKNILIFLKKNILKNLNILILKKMNTLLPNISSAYYGLNNTLVVTGTNLNNIQSVNYYLYTPVPPTSPPFYRGVSPTPRETTFSMDHNMSNWNYNGNNSGNTVVITIPSNVVTILSNFVSILSGISITTDIGTSNQIKPQNYITPVAPVASVAPVAPAKPSSTISTISGQNPLTITGTNLINTKSINYYSANLQVIIDDNPNGTSWSYENNNSIIATKPAEVTPGIWNIVLYNSDGMPSNTIYNYTIL